MGTVSPTSILPQIAFHHGHGAEATVASVVPPGRYGALEIVDGQVKRFVEKPPGDEGRINGGFFVLNRPVLDRISGDETFFEREPLEGLAKDGELMAWSHNGFWHAMDTLRDKKHLETLWSSGQAPWKIWD